MLPKIQGKGGSVTPNWTHYYLVIIKRSNTKCSEFIAGENTKVT